MRSDNAELTCVACHVPITNSANVRVSDDGILCLDCGTITVEQAYTRLETRFPGLAISIQYHPGHVAARIYDSNPPSCFFGDTPAQMLRDAGAL